MPIPTREFKIEKIIDEEKGVRSLVLAPLDGKPVPFLAGQFMMVSLTLSDGKTKRNAYSISSSQSKPGSIRITFGMHGEFTTALFQKKQGETLLLDGPWGKFVLDEASTLDAVFIAGGIGITPLISMIYRLHETKSKRKITLFYSSRQPEHLILMPELEKIARENPQFKIVLSLTGEECPDSLQCYRRRIDEQMLKSELGELSGKQYYLCGPPQMVEGVVSLLKSLGVQNENIKTEKW